MEGGGGFYGEFELMAQTGYAECEEGDGVSVGLSWGRGAFAWRCAYCFRHGWNGGGMKSNSG